MKNKSLLPAIIILFIAMNSSAQVTDRDGNRYKTVKIGKQEWMAENLDVSHFRNGDLIPEVEDEDAWKKAGEAHQPAWCYAKPNDPASVKSLHKLYNGYAIHDPRGLTPKNWHIPSSLDWATLIDFLGGEDVAGGKMKNSTGWMDTYNGTNESGFAGLPGGRRADIGLFLMSVGQYGFWWSSSVEDQNFTRSVELHSDSDKLYRKSHGNADGFSVRCIRD